MENKKVPNIRLIIAILIIALLIICIVAIVVLGYNGSEQLKITQMTIIGNVSSALTGGLVGGVVGFYFGSSEQ